MNDTFANLRAKPTFRTSFAVPAAIALIFTFFNLVAVPDPTELVAGLPVGVVETPGMASTIAEKLVEQSDIKLSNYASQDELEEALRSGSIAGALSDTPEGNGVTFTISGNVSMMEVRAARQVASQLGSRPTGDSSIPTVSELYASNNLAANQAPAIALFVIWLAAFVGSMLMFITSMGEGNGRPIAVYRTTVPVAVTLITSLILSAIVGGLSGSFGSGFSLMFVAWPVMLGLVWLFSGLFAWLGFFAVALVLPLVFLQNALGGAIAPIRAIPSWLQPLAETIPFSSVGAAFREAILLQDISLPRAFVLTAAGVGLLLIWAKTALAR